MAYFSDNSAKNERHDRDGFFDISRCSVCQIQPEIESTKFATNNIGMVKQTLDIKSSS